MQTYEQWLSNHKYEARNYSENKCRGMYAGDMAAHSKVKELKEEQKRYESSLPSGGKELWRDGW